MRQPLWLILVVLVMGAGALAAQQPDPAPDPDAPEPYLPEEFGPALHALRRGEIIAVGVFPLALLLTRVAYDYGRWAFDGFDPLSAPYAQPLGADPFPEEKDRIAVAIGAVGVSVAFALVDYLIGVDRERREAAADGAASPSAGG